MQLPFDPDTPAPQVDVAPFDGRLDAGEASAAGLGSLLRAADEDVEGAKSGASVFGVWFGGGSRSHGEATGVVTWPWCVSLSCLILLLLAPIPIVFENYGPTSKHVLQ